MQKLSQTMDFSVAKGTTYRPHWDAQLIWDLKDASSILLTSDHVKSPMLTIESKESGEKMNWEIQLRTFRNSAVQLVLNLLGYNSSKFDCEFDFTVGGQTGTSSCIKSGVFIGGYRLKFNGQGKWEVFGQKDRFEMKETIDEIKRDLCPEDTLRVTVNLRLTLSPVSTAKCEVLEKLPTLPTYASAGNKWIADLYNNSLHSDVTIRCQDEVFHGHKLILRQSSVIDRMITAPMVESLTNVITISDVKPPVLDLFLKSMYGKQFEVPSDCQTLLELIYCAEKYDMKALKLTCLEALAPLLSDENAGELTVVVNRYCDDERFQSYFKTYCQQRHAILIKKPAYRKLYMNNLDAFM